MIFDEDVLPVEVLRQRYVEATAIVVMAMSLLPEVVMRNIFKLAAALIASKRGVAVENDTPLPPGWVVYKGEER